MLQFPALDKFPKLDSLFPRVGTPGAELAVRRLFGGAGEAIVVDPAKVAAACSDTVDMGLPRAIVGPDAVEEHLKKLYPSGTKLVVERIADGERSGGFCWHREAEGLVGIGLRGITYLELDGSGLISRVQEGYEPLFKLDTLLEALLQAANANKGDGEAKTPAATYERASPRTAEGIVRYLWEVAYPGGASPSEALSFFADEIVYEDFNYREPFVGIEAVGEYIGLLDVFTDFVFIPERISQGDQRVCLTWRCEVNGQDGPSGISFNELIMRAIDDPSSLNPIFFAIFNALGVIPAINAALLLPGSRNQAPLPAVPFIVSSFALGFGGIGPYLTLREPRPQPLARSELGFFSRYVSESRLFGAGLLAASLFLVYGLVTISDLTAATTGFSELFASSKLVHVSTIDFCILSLLTFEPIREDMARRGWWTGGDGAEGNNLGRLLAFSLLPVVGPAAYLVARPSLPEE